MKDRILARVKTLPTLSEAVTRLASLRADPNAGAADFERVIRPDPALTANLLRLANAAWFARGRTVTSARQAVTLLGVKRLFEVVTSAAFARVIPSTLPGYQMDASSYWQHSIAVAVLAERLAAELGQPTADLTFTAGLLHDVGKLAVAAFLAEERDALLAHLAHGEATLVTAERATLGTDHAEIGAALATRWALPAPVVQVARHHHAPGDAPEGEARRQCDLVHVADALAHSFGFGGDVGELAREVDAAATTRLGVTSRVLEHAVCESLDAIRQMASMLTS